MMAQQQQPKHKNSMYEEKREEIISPIDGKVSTRNARFLKPLAKTSTLRTSIPKTPFLYEVFSQIKLKKWPFEVHFSGWKKPQKNWGSWYYKLVVNHGTTWLKTGILDGIHSSMHKIPCNKQLILGLCEFWRRNTNTFVFPWGEATITLEDVMVLGGFPLLGGSVYKEIQEGLVDIVDGLARAKANICRRSHASGGGGGVTHSSWMRHFMNREEGEICDGGNGEGEFEHAAFLALWLSRYVFPSAKDNMIKNYVFPIAAHLSKGTPICIAPIVLANLYSDLSLLAEKASDPCFMSSRVNVSGLFQIVQLWVCERFPVFAEKFAKPLSLGDPRVARWDNVEVKVKLPYVRSRLMLGTGFRWRPYADGLENWEILPFYESKEQVLGDFNDFPCSDMPSYSWFCNPCVLVGVKGREVYNPHRVAMQLGFDQDVPGELNVSETVFDQVGFCVPSRNFQPGMTRSYCNWWKDSMSRHNDAGSKALRMKSTEECGPRIVTDQKNVECTADFPQGIQVSPIADSTVKFNLQSNNSENPLKNQQHLSLNQCEIPEVPEISQTMVVVSPRELISNSIESHASVCPRSPSMLKRTTPENKNLDHVPLAFRICTKMAAAKKDRSDNITRERCQTFNDIEHIPLAQRLEAILKCKAKQKPIESHSSFVSVRNLHRRTQTEELASPISDVFSQITRKRRSSLQKTLDSDTKIKENVGSSRTKEQRDALEVRVSKLEKVVAKFGVVQSDADSSVSS